MSIDIMTLVYIVLGLIAGIYIFVPGFRAQVNQWCRITWGKFFRSQVSPQDAARDQADQAIKTQEKARDQAIALMKQQKETVIQLMAQADRSQSEMRRRQDALTKATNDYKRAKELGLGEADLNKLSLAAGDARAAVESYKDTVQKSKDNADRAGKDLEKTIKKIQAYGEKILDNKAKAELVNALNIQSQVSQLTNSIDDLLSESGKAQDDIDRLLAEAEARNKLEGPDETQKRLEEAEQADRARKERERLDAELSGGATPPAQG